MSTPQNVGTHQLSIKNARNILYLKAFTRAKGFQSGKFCSNAGFVSPFLRGSYDGLMVIRSFPLTVNSPSHDLRSYRNHLHMDN